MVESHNDKLDLLLPLKETVESLEDAVHFMSEQYDQVLARIKNIEQNDAGVKSMLGKREAQDEVVQQKMRLTI